MKDSSDRVLKYNIISHQRRRQCLRAHCGLCLILQHELKHDSNHDLHHEMKSSNTGKPTWFFTVSLCNPGVSWMCNGTAGRVSGWRRWRHVKSTRLAVIGWYVNRGWICVGYTSISTSWELIKIRGQGRIRSQSESRPKGRRHLRFSRPLTTHIADQEEILDVKSIMPAKTFNIAFVVFSLVSRQISLMYFNVFTIHFIKETRVKQLKTA